MPRYRNRRTGVTVSMSEAVAARLRDYEPVNAAPDTPEAPAPEAEAPEPPAADQSGGQEQPSEPLTDDDYTNWTVAELRDEARRRNEGRAADDRLHLWQDKSDLIDDLRADDNK